MISSKTINVRKRDGRVEPWMPEKMNNVALWAANGSTAQAETLIRDTEIMLVDGLSIANAFDNLINTAVGKISRISPDWEYTASKLYLMKMYSESVHGIKNKTYPHLSKVIKIGVEERIYSAKIASQYSKADIDFFNSVIDPTQDYTFTHNALSTFDKKYCKVLPSGRKLELPQLTYMRVAMGISWNLGSEFTPELPYTRREVVEKLYWILTKGEATLATPIMNNSFTLLDSFASCVLTTANNSTSDLMNILETVGKYTKGGGGLGVDISLIQAIGSKTKNGVTSGGIVPHIKNVQSVVQSLVQSGTRRGSANITCTWWHYEVETFLELKDASSGTEENRALHLKYTLATNDYLYKCAEENLDVCLFDPLDTPKLNMLFGKEWEEAYLEYVADDSIRRKVISAKTDLFKKFFKYAFQTGNVYELLLDEVNRRTLTNRYIGSSNLCVEIQQPSRGGEEVSEKTIDTENGSVTTRIVKGEEVAICNLASHNVKIFRDTFNGVLGAADHMKETVFIVSLVMNNTIDIGSYMRSAGEYSNKKYRYLGLGQSGWARVMAEEHIKYDDQEAQEFTYLISQMISNEIVYANTELARIFGRNKNIKGTKWEEGELVYGSANPILKERFKHLHDSEAEAILKGRVKKFGVMNILSQAVAPTASSANAKNITESHEPLHALEYQLEGSVSGTVLAPNIRELGQWYSLAYETKPESLIILNCIRQMWIDQGQSFNIYLREKHWSYEYILKLKFLAWKLGMKSWYYTNTPKSEIEDGCFSCGA